MYYINDDQPYSFTQDRALETDNVNPIENRFDTNDLTNIET